MFSEAKPRKTEQLRGYHFWYFTRHLEIIILLSSSRFLLLSWRKRFVVIITNFRKKEGYISSNCSNRIFSLPLFLFQWKASRIIFCDDPSLISISLMGSRRAEKVFSFFRVVGIFCCFLLFIFRCCSCWLQNPAWDDALLSQFSGLALSLHRNTSCKEVSPTSFVTGFDFLSFDSGAFFALELAKKYFMPGRG